MSAQSTTDTAELSDSVGLARCKDSITICPASTAKTPRVERVSDELPTLNQWIDQARLDR